MVFVEKPYLRTTHSSAWSTIRFNQLNDPANWKLKPTTLIPGWQSPLNVFCCCCTITIIFNHRLLFLSRNQGWNRAGHLSGAKNRDKTGFYIFFSRSKTPTSRNATWRDAAAATKSVSFRFLFYFPINFLLLIYFYFRRLSTIVLWITVNCQLANWNIQTLLNGSFVSLRAGTGLGPSPWAPAHCWARTK